MIFKRKSAKIAAYEALVKYDIASLPVPVFYRTEGIKIFTLQFLAQYHREDISDYFKSFGHRGFICYEPKYNNYVIFINGDDPKSLQRWCVSVAIGYIESCRSRWKDSVSISESDGYTDDFAYVYTCPDCILKRDGISSAEQIISTCDIPFDRAREKHKRLKLLSFSQERRICVLEDIICQLIHTSTSA